MSMWKKYVCAVAVVGVLLVTSPASAVSFTGTQVGKPPLSGTITFDSGHMYVSARVGDAAAAWDEDYLAIALDWNNDGLWTEGLDAILVYRENYPPGASYRVVDSLNYAGGTWDCPWSSSDRRQPGDTDWISGMDMSVEKNGTDYVYSATIPLLAGSVSPGDTIGLLVQGFDKNVALYGGNGRSISFWPGSTAFNALYDPTQFADVSVSGTGAVPEPLTLLALTSGLFGLGRYARRRR